MLPVRLLSISLLTATLTLSACASPWKRTPLFHIDDTVLYSEYLETDEGGETPFGFEHPVQISTEKIALILSQLTYAEKPLFRGAETRYVFRPKDVGQLAEAFSTALATLTPNQRLRFVVAQSDWASIVVGLSGTSGVMFSTAPGFLDVAFDAINDRISTPEDGRPESMVFPYDPLEKDRSEELFQIAGAKFHVDENGKKRRSWLEIDIAAVTPAPQPPPTSPQALGAAVAPGPSVPPSRTSLPHSPSAGTAASAATPAPAATVPGGNAAATADPQEAARLEDIERRLRWIKQLRSEGALTDEEYREQFEKIMAEISSPPAPR